MPYCSAWTRIIRKQNRKANSCVHREWCVLFMHIRPRKSCNVKILLDSYANKRANNSFGLHPKMEKEFECFGEKRF